MIFFYFFLLGDHGLRAKRPNLVFFVFRADGTRDVGPKSQLAKCLHLYAHQDLNMIDEDNLVVVLTFARKIELEDKEWIEAAKQKKQEISNFLNDMLGWVPPIEFIENKPPKSMKKNGDFTVFPNGRIQQPLNLFKAITELLNVKGDIVGKKAVREFFSRKEKKSKLSVVKGKEIKASIEGEFPMAKEESEIFIYLQGGEQASPSSSTLSHTEKVLTWRTSQATDLDDPSGEEEDDDENALDQLPVATRPIGGKTIPDKVLRAEEYVIGRCYLSKEETILPEQIIVQAELAHCFTQHEKNHNEAKKVNETESSTTSNDASGQGYLDPSLKAKANTTGASETSQSSDKSSVYVGRVRLAMSQPFKEKLRSDDGEQCLNKSFTRALKDLKPNKDKVFRGKKLDSSFTKFFKTYGEGVVIEARGGGCIRVGESTTNRANARDAGMGASWLDIFNGSTSHLNHYSQQDNSGVWNFVGGDTAFHDKEKFEKWQASLIDLPIFFHMDGDSFDPWPDFVSRLKWLSNHKEISEALQIAHDATFCSTRIEAAEKDKRKDKGLFQKWFW